ncbi:uncharacterized protein LOC143690721 [Tamandua tetradactyla]|uniref:uncharacterized protein LOC143690721 n=1 Tax=Tamandua tetradactyla TaxID=48850 RepID=UPI004053E8CA
MGVELRARAGCLPDAPGGSHRPSAPREAAAPGAGFDSASPFPSPGRRTPLGAWPPPPPLAARTHAELRLRLRVALLAATPQPPPSRSAGAGRRTPQPAGVGVIAGLRASRLSEMEQNIVNHEDSGLIRSTHQEFVGRLLWNHPSSGAEGGYRGSGFLDSGSSCTPALLGCYPATAGSHGGGRIPVSPSYLEELGAEWSKGTGVSSGQS